MWVGTTFTGVSASPRLLYVVTSDLALALLRGQLRYLQSKGFDVTIISSPGKRLDEAAQIENVRTIGVPMERGFAPLHDLVSLWRLWRTIRALNPAITNVSTPKAGLLGGIAGWLAGVPCRFYTLRGLRFETHKGVKRQALIYAELLACCFAHRVICVSQSLREKAIASGVTTAEQTAVFGSGSSNGVDVCRYAPTPATLKRAADLRSELGIPLSAAVVGFAGRLTRDKGVAELFDAFLRIEQRFVGTRLLLLGWFEDEDALPAKTRKSLEAHPHVILAGAVKDTAPYYALMDVFVLPSHREGFPNVVLEAQAARKPVVAARATGTVDAIVNGETGLLFPIGDVAALVRCLQKLLSDKVFANRLGTAGLEVVKREFCQEMVWNSLIDEYRRLLQQEKRHKVSIGNRAEDLLGRFNGS
jgi:glycosyltransferase involved in cell wall biosynthesis